MTISFWQKNQSKKTDILIIGAGIAGLSSAYWLNKKYPEKTIVVMDKQNIFSGTSGKNAGFLSLGGVSFLERDLKENDGKNILKIKNNIEFMSQEIDFANIEAKKNGTSLIFKKEELERYQKLSEGLLKIGINNKISQSKTISGLLELKYNDAYSINPIKVRDAIVKKLTNKVVFELGISVKELNENKVLTEMGEIEFDEVVVATGFSNLSNENLVPTRAQAMAVKLDTDINLIGNYSYAEKGIYFRKENDSLIIGGSRLLDKEKENTFKDDLNNKIQQALQDFVSDHFSKFTIISQWSGILSYTEDKLPIVYKKDNKAVITGMSGHGMAFGFYCGKEIADLI